MPVVILVNHTEDAKNCVPVSMANPRDTLALLACAAWIVCPVDGSKRVGKYNQPGRLENPWYHQQKPSWRVRFLRGVCLTKTRLSRRQIGPFRWLFLLIAAQLHCCILCHCLNRLNWPAEPLRTLGRLASRRSRRLAINASSEAGLTNTRPKSRTPSSSPILIACLIVTIDRPVIRAASCLVIAWYSLIAGPFVCDARELALTIRAWP